MDCLYFHLFKYAETISVIEVTHMSVGVCVCIRDTYLLITYLFASPFTFASLFIYLSSYVYFTH